ncbi:hypothetical protein HMPREF9078_00657 [Capnocytophaga sp. oral taxon 380 str. F0488]|nr:hypothetical protein HMPREF9078_00657 [Capnocytophaga sp. oral taxon 380 str. F0488]
MKPSTNLLFISISTVTYLRHSFVIRSSFVRHSFVFCSSFVYLPVRLAPSFVRLFIICLSCYDCPCGSLCLSCYDLASVFF